MTPIFPPYQPPQPSPGREPQRSRDDSDDLPSPREPSLSTTLRGLGKLSWLLVPLFGWLFSLQIAMTRTNADIETNARAIAAIHTEISDRAARRTADFERVERAQHDLQTRLDARDEHVAGRLDEISRTLERVCARVQCGRSER